ncbi:hypothetical protein QBC34DRAFT_413452 [Podospora aff. communis PSN243]|uniref:Thioredoxin domain-containing protein n=1 Tax=Podospora aff. communis PSN243 TaxID=3040156 RepID=A0AAV9GA17_9PEZI|nr:hypothetical protein QBC34DRAFT_413452 [Podospora aff. communis PSN243]
MGLPQVDASSLPSSPDGLKDGLPKAGDSTYLFFIVGNDEATGQPWCPDVRAALPVVEKYFAQHPDLDISTVSVGSRPEWKDPERSKLWRSTWGIRAVPTLVKYTRTEEGISQEQLVELDAAVEENVEKFTKGL